jgi:hypothetical protein
MRPYQFFKEVAELLAFFLLQFLHNEFVAFCCELFNVYFFDVVLDAEIVEALVDVEGDDVTGVEGQHGYPVLLLAFRLHHLGVGDCLDDLQHQVRLLGNFQLVQGLQAAAVVEFFQDVYEESCGFFLYEDRQNLVG